MSINERISISETVTLNGGQEPLYENERSPYKAGRTATIGLPMTSFKPSEFDQVTSSMPSNWSMRPKTTPIPAVVATPATADAVRSSVIRAPSQYIEDEIEPHLYSNVGGGGGQLPEIDEAGYASLIVTPTKPIMTLTSATANDPGDNGNNGDSGLQSSGDDGSEPAKEPQYQELERPENNNNNNNVYQNAQSEEIIGENYYENAQEAREAEMYARVDMAKKRASSSSNNANKDVEDKPEMRETNYEEDKIVEKFSSFFAQKLERGDGIISHQDELRVSHC